MALSTADQIQEMYIAYYGRPADPAGLEYWTQQAEAAGGFNPCILAFGSAPEATDLHAGMTTEEMVNSLYNQLFGRDAEAAGLAYWTELIDNGTVPLVNAAWAMINGAQGTDADAVANKLAAANDFMTALDTDAEIAAYSGNTAAATARTWLATVDETADSLTAAEGTMDDTINDIMYPSVPGETFTLTTAADPVIGTANDDTITAASGTLNSTDLISDSFSNDNDTLNAVYKTADMAATPTISGIENINITIDAFAGTATTFNATNVTGATITLSSTKLGFDGAAGVANAGDNNVTAGTNVDTLTVAGLEAGVVDAGAADTVSVTTAAATDVANVTVNGDVDLTVATATDIAITATAASVVTLTAAAATDVVVTGEDVTLEVTAAQVTTDTITGAAAVVVGTAASADLTGVDAPITLDDDFAATTIDVANGADVTFGEAQTGTVTVAGDAANATNSVTLNTGFDVATLDVQDNGLTTTINATAAVVIATLTATGEDVVLTGADDVEVTTSDAASFDASAFTGNLIYTSTASADIVLGSGENEVTVADADTAVTGLGGADSVDATAVTAANFAAELGAGDDIVKVDAPTGTIAVDFGTGTDTLWLKDAADLTGASLNLVGAEKIEIENVTVGAADAGVAVDVLGSQLSGTSYTVTTTEAADTVAVNVTADAATTDLSTLTLTNIDSVVITGQATAETIKGTSANDEITAGGGADTLTGGAGADEFIFGAGNTSAAAVGTITDFSIAQFDVLNIVTAVVAGDKADVDVKAAITGGTGSEVVTADVVDGILTLSGADAATIDTLTEWQAVVLLADTAATAETMAFVFGEDTYVMGITAGDAIDNVIKLAGVTDLVAVDTAAGVNTLVIS